MEPFAAVFQFKGAIQLLVFLKPAGSLYLSELIEVNLGGVFFALLSHPDNSFALHYFM